MRRSLVLSVVAVSVAGCAAGRSFIAVSPDYDEYRATRDATTAAGRLDADARYLKDRPDGQFADDVRADLDKAEPRYFASHRSTMVGLESYLELYPKGRHAGDARITLSGLRAHAEAPDAHSAAAVETGRSL